MDLQYEHNRSFDGCSDIAHSTDPEDSETDSGLFLDCPIFAHDDIIGLKQFMQLDVVVIKN